MLDPRAGIHLFQLFPDTFCLCEADPWLYIRFPIFTTLSIHCTPFPPLTFHSFCHLQFLGSRHWLILQCSWLITSLPTYPGSLLISYNYSSLSLLLCDEHTTVITHHQNLSLVHTYSSCFPIYCPSSLWKHSAFQVYVIAKCKTFSLLERNTTRNLVFYCLINPHHLRWTFNLSTNYFITNLHYPYPPPPYPHHSPIVSLFSLQIKCPIFICTFHCCCLIWL